MIVGRGNSPIVPFRQYRRFAAPLAPCRSGLMNTESLSRRILAMWVRNANRVTVDFLVLVLPALLDKRIVHFPEDDDGEEGVIVVRR
jgi:hypothetical protein